MTHRYTNTGDRNLLEWLWNNSLLRPAMLPHVEPKKVGFTFRVPLESGVHYLCPYAPNPYLGVEVGYRGGGQ